MWPFTDPDDAFRSAVRQVFGPLARECNASFKQIEPLIYGFATDHAVLTVGAYPGHFRGICVKLRRRIARERVSVDDRTDIGLKNFEEFVSGTCTDIYSKRQRWAAEEIREEISGLALAVRQFAMPYLTTPNGDWAGLRAFIDEKIEQRARTPMKKKSNPIR
ncbi:MAG TPA: hypothetical protein VGM64_08030 [Lacunisphaera sp.]|jgi:hypothetical protein